MSYVTPPFCFTPLLFLLHSCSICSCFVFRPLLVLFFSPLPPSSQSVAHTFNSSVSDHLQSSSCRRLIPSSPTSFDSMPWDSSKDFQQFIHLF
ncbi:hypothetical protein BS17DRAFT_778660 [Gyrodon lividus]|nr:hypothetical protein BS17DRAFT_778660 [Gyrodon lividus]